MRGFILVLVFTFIAFAASGADQPLYQPAAAWVKSLAIPKAKPADGAATQMLLEDVQDNFTQDGLDSYWEQA